MTFSHRQLASAISGLSLLFLSALPMVAQAAPPPQQVAAAVVPRSMLQQPAMEAKIVFAGDTLAIHAENASLTAILRSFAAKSGMKIEGLGGDERVFGTFGPGTPRDVLADLLNGTTYNVVLLGKLENGAPRELLLTPTTHGAAPAAAAVPANPDVAGGDPANPDPSVAEQPSAEPEQEAQGPLDLPTPVEDPLPAPGAAEQQTPGVKTPQQLFEQLQQMRQQQQNAGQDAQPEDTPVQQ
jgi:hypothetical protein